MFRWFRRWMYRRQRWQRLCWALYDAGLLSPDAPPPPFKRPPGAEGVRLNTIESLRQEGCLASMTFVCNHVTLTADKGNFQVGRFATIGDGERLWKLLYIGTDEASAVKVFREASHQGRKE